MEILITKDELNKAINTVKGAIPNKTTLPLLECILIMAADTITIMANSLDLGIKAVADGEIKEKGKIAINAKNLSELARKLPEGIVSIKTDDTNVTFKCGKFKAVVSGMSGDEYPNIQATNPKARIEISQMSLKNIIRQTIFSVSDNDANKIMTGECFEVNGDKLSVTALDGHRIARRSVLLKHEYDNTTVIIPAKALSEVLKAVSGNGDAEIQLGDNHAVFEFDRASVTTRLIEGQYFDIDKMLNLDFSTEVSANRKELYDSVDRSTLVITSTDKRPIVVDFNDNSIKWTAKTNTDALEDEINAVKRGEDLRMGFNPRLLLDVLNVIDDENVTLGLTSPKQPCVIKDDGSYMYLVLPVNIGDAK